jgi:DNA repair protein RecO (recombination protein O)
VLDREADGGAPVRPDCHYVYSTEQGLLPAVATGADGAVSGETLRRLAGGERLTGVHAREARALTRRLLAPHLGERPLQSRALFAGRRTGRVLAAVPPELALSTTPESP